VSQPAARSRTVTVAWVATALVSLAAIVLTGLQWEFLTPSDAVSNAGDAAGRSPTRCSAR
jgi:hypothetical protein